MQNSVCYQLRNSELLVPSLKQSSKIEVSKRIQPNFSSNHNKIEFSKLQPTYPLNHIKTARISNFFHDVYHFLKANSYKNPPHPLAPRDLGTMASMLEKWWFHSEMLGFMVSKWSNNAGFGELISIFPRQIAQRLPDVPLIFCASRFTMISGKRRAGHHFCRSRPWHGHFWGFAILVSKLRLANRWRRCKNGGLIWFIWLDMVNNG